MHMKVLIKNIICIINKIDRSQNQTKSAYNKIKQLTNRNEKESKIKSRCIKKQLTTKLSKIFKSAQSKLTATE